MAFLNYMAREIATQVAFWGCAGAGKHTSLTHLHALVREPRGKVQWVDPPPDDLLHFHLLPNVTIRGMPLRIAIRGFHGAEPDPASDAHARWLFKGTDGIVFVVDSRRDRLDANVASFEKLSAMREPFAVAGAPPAIALLYNKRDLPAAELLTIDELNRALNPGGEWEVFEGVATRNEGVTSAMKATLRPALARLPR